MGKKLIIYVLAALIIAALLFGLASDPLKPKHEEIHRHFDFRLYLDGQAVDLSQDQYQSIEGHELNEAVHLHDNDGEVVHVHAEGVTLDEFLDSIGVQLPVTGDTKVFVNGKEDTRGLAYQPQDLDRILAAHDASQDEIATQLALVTDRACIYSEKCPERGQRPPTETCVGQCVI